MQTISRNRSTRKMNKNHHIPILRGIPHIGQTPPDYGVKVLTQ